MFKVKSLYFKHKVLIPRALASILLGGILLSSCTPNEDANTLKSQQVIENPFVFEQLKIPFVTSMQGGGMKSRLKSEKARETINKVFQEAGITLEADYHYKKNGINIKLDGYDAKRKIGYVWIDEENYGAGILRGWWNYGYYYNQAKEEILNTADVTAHSDLENVKSHIGTLIENEFDGDLAVNYADKFNTIIDLINEDEKSAAYKELYIDILIQREQNNNKSGQFPIHKINKNSSYKEKETAYLDWTLRGKIEKMTQNIPKKETLNKILHSILDLKDETLKENHYNDLVNFLQRYHDKYGTVDPANDNLLVEDVQQMKKNIADYANGFSNEKITLREAQSIDALSKVEGDFIAPVSRRDLRFTHNRIIGTSYGKISKIQQTENEEAYYEAQKKSFEALQTQVRQYIQWAKQQSGQ